MREVRRLTLGWRSTDQPRDLRLLLGLSLVGLIFTAWLFGPGPGLPGAGWDAYAYWDVQANDVYGRSFGQLTAFGAFRYSPPIALVCIPLHLIPWPIYFWAFLGLLVATLLFLGGKWTLAALAFPGVAISIYMGNIDLLLAAAVAIGLASPLAWVFAILTKPTMAVCLVWYAVRRDWRSLGLIAGGTLVVVAPTVLLRPDLWRDYLAMLVDNARLPTGQEFGPLLVRLPAAVGMTVWGARSERPWLVGLAAGIAQPLLGLRSASVAAAALYLARAERNVSVGDIRRGNWLSTRVVANRLLRHRTSDTSGGDSVAG